MTTPQTPREHDLVAAKFEAEVREADARLKVLKAQAEASKAKADMDQISGLAAARERVKKNIANLKQQAHTSALQMIYLTRKLMDQPAQ